MFRLTRAPAWYRAAVNLVRPRRTSDQLQIGAAQIGSPAAGVAHLSVDAGTQTVEAIGVRGIVNITSGFLTVVALSNAHPTTSNLTSNCEVALYMRNGKLAFAFNCGGTINYLAINLDGQDIEWTQGTEPP